MKDLLMKLMEERVTMSIGSEALFDGIVVKFSTKKNAWEDLFVQRFQFSREEIELANGDVTRLLRISFDAFMHDYKKKAEERAKYGK